MIKKVFLTLLAVVLLSLPVFAKSNKLVVYPNPWIPESGKSLSTDRGDRMKHGSYTADGWIKFKGVNEKNRAECHGDLRIYDITGHLIRNKEWSITEEQTIPLPQTHKEGDRTNIVHWDGRNNDYEYVESGVYIWIIRVDDGSKYDGKVVVLR